MLIIAQTKKKSNEEISKAGMAEVIQTLQDGGRLNDLIAVEILKGSNEKALDILRVCGCEAVVPGTIYAPINDVAKFYQCKPSYLLSLLNRFGITPTKTPTDVMKCGFPYFLWHYKLEQQFAVSAKYSVYTMIDKETHKHYEFSHSSKAGNFYSARVVLALAMLMYFGRVINPDAMGNEIHQKLLASTYHDAAQKVIAERKEKLLEEARATEVKPETAPSENAAVMSDGKIVMTADFLAGIIKTAVREAVSEVVKVAAPSVQTVITTPQSSPASGSKNYAPGTLFNSAGNPCRLAKPTNWDEVLAKYRAGAITQAAAARMTGMSVTTFSKYSKGQSDFYKS